MECALGRYSAGSSQDYDDCCSICVLGHERRIKTQKEGEEMERDEENVCGGRSIDSETMRGKEDFKRADSGEGRCRK